MPAAARASVELATARPADQLALRRHNLSTVLRRVQAAGPRSRARLATETGLNRATVSSLVADLVDRGLLRDGALEPATVGRPGQYVEVDGAGVCGIGIEVNVDHLAAVVVDLRGRVLAERRVPFDTARRGPAAVLDRVAALVAECTAAADAAGAAPMGLTVAVPGLVDAVDGTVAVAPNLGWTAVPVADLLTARLERPAPPVLVDNEANLAALGEHAAGSSAGVGDLVLLTGEVGLGGGIVAGGRLVRGGRGYGGEVGHMPLDPGGAVCGCGRRGCWESVAGLSALLRLATDPDDPVRDVSRDLDERLRELVRRAEQGDDRTVAALERVGTWLGIGAAVLVNVLNPTVLVLGGSYAVLGDWLLAPLRRELAVRTVAPELGGCRVELSVLGSAAAARGAAQVALEAVLDDPTLVPPLVRDPALASGGPV